MEEDVRPPEWTFTCVKLESMPLTPDGRVPTIIAGLRVECLPWTNRGSNRRDLSPAREIFHDLAPEVPVKFSSHGSTL
jgi:hypothetical protein